MNALRRYKGDLPDGYQVSKVLHTNQRLKRLNLLSLELRRLHADLVMCYKIVFGLVKLSFTNFFAFRPVTVTRGHQYKLYVNHSHGIRKHFFTERVVAPWNSLSADTDFSSLNRFKRCINAVDFRKFLTFNCRSVSFVFMFSCLCAIFV